MMGVGGSATPVDFATLFGREAPVTLEIGFGMGARLVAMAKARARSRISSALWCIHRCGACLASAHERALKYCVMCHDAVEVLHTMIPDNSFIDGSIT
ncbi:hypothetical protein KCP75_16340 [Salmonella enterica subsp. enterica]|nr:hypothetical protein KCP75_16340 [Salmonella enterica subsp. enterica]